MCNPVELDEGGTSETLGEQACMQECLGAEEERNMKERIHRNSEGIALCISIPFDHLVILGQIIQSDTSHVWKPWR